MLASWVVLSHVLLIPLPRAWAAVPGLQGAYDAVFNGPAAVIVFFLISGLCIHFPFRDAERIDLVAYYARRHLRILIPVVVACALGVVANVQLWRVDESVLWSLVCEEIYYTLYPGLFRLRRTVRWRGIIATSFAFALIVMFLVPGDGNYHTYGWRLNWIVGLPCWLMGCVLAEQIASIRARAVERESVPTVRAIWAWRFGAWALSVVSLVLRFHSPIGYPWTLTAFSLYAFFWIRREIAYATTHGAGVFERVGVAAYTIYLVHPVAAGLAVRWLPRIASAQLAWLITIAIVALVSLVFYRFVERPSHRLARSVGRRIIAFRDARRALRVAAA